MKIWIDIKNSHEPAFFKPFINRYRDYDFFITARESAEIISLLNKFNYKSTTIGSHLREGNKITKMLSFTERVLLLFAKVPKFDVSISHGSFGTIIAKLRHKKSIHFDDNEKSGTINKLFFRYSDYLITPNAIPVDCLKKLGAKNIIQYNGFKEDIYVADYMKDGNFYNNIPFKKFITIRPEALQAIYVSKGAKTIVPELLKGFSNHNINILYLPRAEKDKSYSNGFQNVFTPPEPLNGLDVCYYSKAVLTGSGTFAREAACIGTPAVSFFPEKLLAVDQKMVNDGWMFHSRDPKEIVEYVLNSKKRKVDLSRSKKVQREVFDILKGILEEIEDRKKEKK